MHAVSQVDIRPEPVVAPQVLHGPDPEPLEAVALLVERFGNVRVEGTPRSRASCRTASNSSGATLKGAHGARSTRHIAPRLGS